MTIENLVPSPRHPADQGEVSRKARKRETDRRAQRQHRIKQKAYVKQLEELVKDLSAQQNLDERLAEVQMDNTRLRQLCNSLLVKLHRIRVLAHQDIDASHAMNPQAAGETLQTPTVDITLSIDSAANDAQNVDDDIAATLDLADLLPQPSPGKESCLKPNLSASFNSTKTAKIGELDASRCSKPVDTTEVLPGWHQGVSLAYAGSNEGDCVPDYSLLVLSESDLEPDLAGLDHSTLEEDPLGWSCGHVSIIESSPGAKRSSESAISFADQPDCNAEIPSQLLNGPPTPLSATSHNVQFPRFGQPKGLADVIILDFLEEAREEHRRGRFDHSRPSLRRLLSSTPVDCLSFRLFNFVTGWGPAPMHYLLATFWVQYLYLRWQILGTTEAYELIPSFMRPVGVEYVVPHQAFIGMLVWPNLRQALVRDSEFIDIDRIGMDLLAHLETGWDNRANAGQPTTMDVIDLIETQSSNSSFWRVQPSFFEKYPQYTHCF